MSDEIDLSQFDDLFREESKRLLGSAGPLISRVRRAPDDTDAFGELHRVAHTLKSMFATMGMERASILSRSLSRALDSLKKGLMVAGSGTADTVARSFEALETAAGGGDVPEADRLAAELESLLERERDERDELRSVFLEEAREHLAAVRAGVLGLKARPDDPDALGELYRRAHSLKSMAATMDFSRMQSLSASLEEVFRALRERGGAVTDDALRTLAEAAVVLSELLKALDEGGSEGDIPVDTLTDRLKRLQETDAA